MFYTYWIKATYHSFAHWGEHENEKKSFLMYCHHYNSSMNFRNYTVASKANYLVLILGCLRVLALHRHTLAGLRSSGTFQFCHNMLPPMSVAGFRAGQLVGWLQVG